MVRTVYFHRRGLWVWSLVRELRYCMPHGMPRSQIHTHTHTHTHSLSVSLCLSLSLSLSHTHWNYCMLSQIHLSFSLPLPHIVYVFWVLVNLSSVEFLTFHCLYLSFLVRMLLEGISVSEHRWTILPGGLGVEQRCHPLPLIRISENGR